MSLMKQPTWRSRKYLDQARGQQCVRCGAWSETVVAAHYTGYRQHTYGKGRGVKPSDVAVADLCRECHEHFDRPEQRKSTEASEEFLHCILLTIMRRLAAGVLRG